jgi:hypothetical protein
MIVSPIEAAAGGALIVFLILFLILKSVTKAGIAFIIVLAILYLLHL